MIDNITMTCGVLATGSALIICIAKMLPARKKKPATELTPQELAVFREKLHKLDALYFDLEQTRRMRKSGLKCSVVNGKVVYD